MTIGRAPTNSIQLEDETVSGLHAEIERVGPGKYVLRDLGSSNGTFVDGVAITEVEISRPCKIAFGALQFEIKEEVEPEAAVSAEAGKSPDARVVILLAANEKLRKERERERKGLLEQISQIEKESEKRLLKKRKDYEALGRTIGELQKGHAVEIDNERRKYSEKLANLQKQSEASLLEKHKECEGLSQAIKELKSPHAAQLENERREHLEKAANLQKRNEASLLEKQKECNGLNRVIEELKVSLTAQLESERREHFEKAASLQEQSEMSLLEKQKECEGLNRAIEELKASLTAQFESERREHSEKAAHFQEQSEMRLLEKQKECDGLTQAIEALKASHTAQVESDRYEHFEKAANLQKENEASLLEKRKECEGLNRAIEELKASHAAQLESERREHSEKAANLQKENEAGLLEKQKECEGLNRAVEELKSAHGTERDSERRQLHDRIATLEREKEETFRKKQDECDALNREVEALKKSLREQAESHRKTPLGAVEGAGPKAIAEDSTAKATGVKEDLEQPQSNPPQLAGESAEKRTMDSFPIEKSSEIEIHLAAVKPRWSRPTLASRRGTGQWLRTFLWAGILGFGLCLLAQSLPSTVLPSMNPLRIVSRGNDVVALATAKDSPTRSSDRGSTADNGTAPQSEAPVSDSSPSVADSGLNAPSSDDPNEALQSDSQREGRKSAEISMDPSVTHGQPLSLAPSAEKKMQPATNGNTTALEPGKAEEKAPAEPASTVTTAANSTDKSAAAVESAQTPASICPCATGESWNDDRLTTTVSDQASAVGTSAVAASKPSIAAEKGTTDQSVAASSEPGKQAAIDAGPNLQEVGGASGESVQSGGDRTRDNVSAVVPQLTDSENRQVGGSRVIKGSRGMYDLAKGDIAPSISGALRRETPSGKGAKGTQPLRVLILGDSLSLCGFGKRLDQKFRDDAQVESVYTYMACGTTPLSWLKEKPYTSVKTLCGFWSIESSLGKPKELVDTYGMKQGYIPKPHPVPKLEELLETVHPDILVMQCGTNLFSLFENRTTVQPAKDGPMVRNYITPFMNAARKCASLKKIYWVAPPTSGRAPIEIQDFVFNETNACAGWMAKIIDSRPLVTYPYHNMEPDHEHFMGTDMTQWADRIYTLLKQDISAQPFESFPSIAQLQPPAIAEAPKKKESDETAEPLYVQAKLAFKSQPIPLKELMPYQESLVGFVYDVSQVVNGQYEDKQILVLHPSYIGLKPQPLERYKMGKMYKLRLHEVEATPWHTVKCQDESGRIDLIPYIQVEDERKFPGNSR